MKRILPGTENMAKYPRASWANHLRGIDHYGSIRVNGVSALKIDPANVAQLETLGYKQVGAGTAYVYMVAPTKTKLLTVLGTARPSN